MYQMVWAIASPAASGGSSLTRLRVALALSRQ